MVESLPLPLLTVRPTRTGSIPARSPLLRRSSTLLPASHGRDCRAGSLGYNSRTSYDRPGRRAAAVRRRESVAAEAGVTRTPVTDCLGPEEQELFGRVLRSLNRQQVPFLLAGGY